MTMRGKRAHSWTRMTATLFILVNAVMMIVFCLVCTGLSRNAMQHEVESYVDKTLDQAVIIWDNTVRDLYSRMLQLKNLDQVRACLTMPSVDYAETLAYEREIDKIFKEIDLFRPVVEDVMILGNNGYVYNLSSRNNLLSDYDFRTTSWYQEAIDDTGGIYIRVLPLHDQRYVNPRISASTAGETTFSISMAVTTANRQVVGAVVCSLNLRQLGVQLMSSNYEKSGKIAMVDADGVIIGQNDNTCIGDTLEGGDTLWDLADAADDHVRREVKGRMCLITVRASEMTPLHLVSYIPMDEIMSHATPLRVSMLVLLAALLLVGVLLSLVLSRALDRPVRQMVHRLAGMDETHLTSLSEDGAYRELNVIAQRFNELMQKLDVLIRRDYVSQLQLKRSQLSALQEQIKPHFLFNTLQLLQTEIVCQNLEESNAIIVSLSRLLRYTMRADELEVPLRSEMEYLRDYLHLFVKKYDGQLAIAIHQDEALDDCLVPKLILQPIVENCIRHAFGDDPQNSHIDVDVRAEDGRLTIAVSDDGQGIPPKRLEEVNRSLDDKDAENIGLRNVHRRLRTLYGPPYGIEIVGKHKGTLVVVTLPRTEKAGDALST